MDNKADDTFDRAESGFYQIHRVHTSGVWTFLTKFRFMSIVPLQNRAVIFLIPPTYENKDAQGSLAIVNPCKLTKDTIEGIHRIERETNSVVRYLISPGDWHYMHIGPYLAGPFPHAKAYLLPGRAPSKLLSHEFVLIDISNPLPELRPHLEMLVVKGLRQDDSVTPRYEAVFYHAASNALTSGDVLQFSREPIMQPWSFLLGWLIEPHLNKLSLHFGAANWKGIIMDPQAMIASLQKVVEFKATRFISLHGAPGNMLTEHVCEDLLEIIEFLRHPPIDFVKRSQGDTRNVAFVPAV